MGWADVATKRDLESLENKLVAAFRAELGNFSRTMFIAIVTIVLTMSSLVLAVLALAR